MNGSLYHTVGLGNGVKVETMQTVGRQLFVHTPVEWVRLSQKAGGAFTVNVALLVWFRRSVTRLDQFTVGNAVAGTFGLNRKQKTAGLRALEQAGLIEVQRTQGASPRVHIRWEPGCPADKYMAAERPPSH